MAFAPIHQKSDVPLLGKLSLLFLLSFFPAARSYSLQDACQGLEELQDNQARCSYVQTHGPCSPRGYIDYLHVFYCILADHPLPSYLLLFLWLLLLFYLLGNTASRYFCSSLDGLSKLLRLPPTIAGATLLPLGNGAADVFSSFVSFAGSGVGVVGLSSVLGSALFISTVVVGIISIGVGSRAVIIDRSGFIRDLCFLAAALCSLLSFLITGRIHVWCSVCFVSLYIFYIIAVWIGHCCEEKPGELAMPLLDSIEVAVEDFNDGSTKGSSDHDDINPGWFKLKPSVSCCFRGSIYLVWMPLYLPRRLTIPDVSEERWSKPFAVASAVLAPLLLATLWNSKIEDEEMGSDEWLAVYLCGGLVGVVLGVLAAETTEKHGPPRRRGLFPWLAGGFLMTVIWVYIIARELVALLVSIGYILGIRPLVLGLTVLAWGNSLGDLIANVAIAVNGRGSDGVQMAISGCYAGPLFNILFGLGMSLVLAAWASPHQSPFEIPRDPSLFETMGFLAGALLWALAMLPMRGMKPDRILGTGLLLIYLSFLCLRLSESLGLLQLGSFLHL